MRREGFYLGLLNVLEWPKLLNPTELPPFEYDSMRTYHSTSRDGIHFDTSWVYAGQEFIPRGACKSQGGGPYCVPLSDLDETTASSGAAPLDEMCCPFDHGITIPASNLITVPEKGEHLLYYEGRVAYHEKRYGPTFPVGIGIAAWKLHRIAGVRHDPNATDGKRCGTVTTKSFDLTAIRTSKGLPASGQVYITVNVGGLPAATSRGGDGSALYAEIVPAAEKAAPRRQKQKAVGGAVYSSRVDPNRSRFDIRSAQMAASGEARPLRASRLGDTSEQQ